MRKGAFFVFVFLLVSYWLPFLFGTLALDIAFLGQIAIYATVYESGSQVCSESALRTLFIILAIGAAPFALVGVVVNGMAIFRTPGLIYEISRKQYDLLVDVKLISPVETMYTYQPIKGNSAIDAASEELESETLAFSMMWFKWCLLYVCFVSAAFGICHWIG
jgi:hypothetical protein